VEGAATGGDDDGVVAGSVVVDDGGGDDGSLLLQLSRSPPLNVAVDSDDVRVDSVMASVSANSSR